MFNTLNDDHIKYIIVRRHIENANIVEVYAELIDKDAWEKYNIVPVPQLSKHYFYKRVQRIPQTSIEVVKVEWTLAILDEPLSRGRARVRKLTEIVHDPSTPASVRVAAIRAIGDITGDEDAAIKALKESGKTDVRISLADKLLEKYDNDDSE